jgi:hypothetical protein
MSTTTGIGSSPYSDWKYSLMSRVGSCVSADPRSAATMAATLFGERPGSDRFDRAMM